MLNIKCLYYVSILSLFCIKCFGQQFVNLDAKAAEATFLYKKQMVIKAFGTEINCLIMTIYINTVVEWLCIRRIIDHLQSILLKWKKLFLFWRY